MTLLDHLRYFESLRKTTGGVPQIVTQLKTIMARAMILQQAYERFQSGVTNLIVFPFSEIQATIDLITNLVQFAFDALDAPYAFIVDLRGTKRSIGILRFHKPLFDPTLLRGEVLDIDTVAALASKKVYQVQYGDTLRGIAGRMLNDSTRWSELVALNALDYPYIVYDPADVPAGKKVLAPGDFLVLPQSASDVGNSVLTEKPNSLTSVVGRDIFLANDGHLEFDGHGDWRMVEGVANITQATRNRLLTDHGELVLHPNYGSNLKALIGQEATLMNIAIARLETARTLNEESRFTRVQDVSAQFDSTVVTVAFTAYVINQESPSAYNLVIQRAA